MNETMSRKDLAKLFIVLALLGGIGYVSYLIYLAVQKAKDKKSKTEAPGSSAPGVTTKPGESTRTPGGGGASGEGFTGGEIAGIVIGGVVFLGLVAAAVSYSRGYRFTDIFAAEETYRTELTEIGQDVSRKGRMGLRKAGMKARAAERKYQTKLEKGLKAQRKRGLPSKQGSMEESGRGSLSIERA